MKVVVVRELGGPEVLKIQNIPEPLLLNHQVMIDVHATALNRADLLQRRGEYPPPKGESDILGLECSGVVSACGSDVDPSFLGKRVMALLAGGGYAERVAVDAQMLMPIPAKLDFVQAAAIPEAFLTAHEALSTLGQLAPRQRVLIHAAAGGVGSAAIQLASGGSCRLNLSVITRLLTHRTDLSCACTLHGGLLGSYNVTYVRLDRSRFPGSYARWS